MNQVSKCSAPTRPGLSNDQGSCAKMPPQRMTLQQRRWWRMHQSWHYRSHCIPLLGLLGLYIMLWGRNETHWATSVSTVQGIVQVAVNGKWLACKKCANCQQHNHLSAGIQMQAWPHLTALDHACASERSEMHPGCHCNAAKWYHKCLGQLVGPKAVKRDLKKKKLELSLTSARKGKPQGPANRSAAQKWVICKAKDAWKGWVLGVFTTAECISNTKWSKTKGKNSWVNREAGGGATRFLQLLRKSLYISIHNHTMQMLSRHVQASLPALVIVKRLGELKKWLRARQKFITASANARISFPGNFGIKWHHRINPQVAAGHYSAKRQWQTQHSRYGWIRFLSP